MKDWIKLKGTYCGYQIRFEHLGQIYELKTKTGVKGKGYSVELTFSPFKMICVEAKWKEGSLFERLISLTPKVIPINCQELNLRESKIKSYKSRFSEKGYYTNLNHYELFEDPENLIFADHYFKNPFAYPLEVHALTEIIYRDKCGSNDNLYKNWFQTLETSRIDVASIVPTQKFLLGNKLENWEERPITIYPEFIKSGNYYYLLDGHHRVAKWIEQGVETIEGKVTDVQNPFSSLEVKPYKSIYSEKVYTVYHGTNNKFNKFNLDKSTYGTIWFTDSIDSIKNGEHGGVGSKYIMTRKITLNNPAGWDEYEMYSIGELRQMGFDGVILPDNGKTDFIVFSTKSIKSMNYFKSYKSIYEGKQVPNCVPVKEAIRVAFEERYNPNTKLVTSKLLRLKNFFLDKSSDEIIHLLNLHFSEYNILFEEDFQRSGSSAQSEVSVVKALYDPATDEIEVYLHPMDLEEMFSENYFNDELFSRFIKVLSYVIGHEMIHRNQISKIQNHKLWNIVNKVKNPEVENVFEYMTSNFEIQSFAYQAVKEYRAVGYSKSEINKYLRNPFKTDNIVESDTMFELFQYISKSDLQEDKTLAKTVKTFLKFAYEYNNKPSSYLEKISVPLEIGDEIKTGKFKNKKAIVKGFGIDDKNQPVVKTSKGDQSMFKFRISKLMPENTNDYAGEHSAPNKSSGAPMHDLSGMYPDDIYSSNAVQYYGDGLPYDGIATAIISYAKNRPNAQVKIYRSVPDINYEVSKQIKEIKDIIKYFDKFNFFPMKNSTVNKLESEYPVNKYGYDGQHEKIYEILELTLSQLEKAKNKPLKLNSGDWVTIVKQYSIEHGKAHLGNKFKLLSKTVPAKHLYSQGDSIHEWGYSP